MINIVEGANCDPAFSDLGTNGNGTSGCGCTIPAGTTTLNPTITYAMKCSSAYTNTILFTGKLEGNGSTMYINSTSTEAIFGNNWNISNLYLSLRSSARMAYYYNFDTANNVTFDFNKNSSGVFSSIHGFNFNNVTFKNWNGGGDFITSSTYNYVKNFTDCKFINMTTYMSLNVGTIIFDRVFLNDSYSTYQGFFNVNSADSVTPVNLTIMNSNIELNTSDDEPVFRITGAYFNKVTIYNNTFITKGTVGAGDDFIEFVVNTTSQPEIYKNNLIGPCNSAYCFVETSTNLWQKNVSSYSHGNVGNYYGQATTYTPISVWGNMSGNLSNTFNLTDWFAYNTSNGWIPAVSCGDILWNSTTLTTDLTGCSVSALRLTNNTILDCNNHKITGTGAGGTAGILIGAKSNITIKNCEINSFDYGMYIYDTASINITNNTVWNNTEGLYVEHLTSNSVITNNTLYSNNYGINLNSGAGAEYTIYNNWLNNTLTNAVKNLAGENYIYWNITKTLGTNKIGGAYLGGNYWSNYTGLDTDGDGLGNTNYTSGNVIDYLPLTNNIPFVPFNWTTVTAGFSTITAECLAWNSGGIDNYSISINGTGETVTGLASCYYVFTGLNENQSYLITFNATAGETTNSTTNSTTTLTTDTIRMIPWGDIDGKWVYQLYNFYQAIIKVISLVSDDGQYLTTITQGASLTINTNATNLYLNTDIKVDGCIQYNCSQPTGCVSLGVCLP